MVSNRNGIMRWKYGLFFGLRPFAHADEAYEIVEDFSFLQGDDLQTDDIAALQWSNEALAHLHTDTLPTILLQRHPILILSMIAATVAVVALYLLWNTFFRAYKRRNERLFLKKWLQSSDLTAVMKQYAHCSMDSDVSRYLKVHMQYLKYAIACRDLISRVSLIEFDRETLTVKGYSQSNSLSLGQLLQQLLETEKDGLVLLHSLQHMHMHMHMIILREIVSERICEVSQSQRAIQKQFQNLQSLMRSIGKTLEERIQSEEITAQEQERLQILLQLIEFDTNPLKRQKFAQKLMSFSKRKQQLLANTQHILPMETHSAQKIVINPLDLETLATQKGRIHKLQCFVEDAEHLELSHLSEVAQAQELLNQLEYAQMASAFQQDSCHALDAMLALKNRFVHLGAKESDAILKAGEIQANRSNTLLLLQSLHGIFEEWKSHDLRRLEERRRRDARKEVRRRERLLEKFRLKRELIYEKIKLQEESHRKQMASEQKELWKKALADQESECLKDVQWILSWNQKCNVAIIAMAIVANISSNLLESIWYHLVPSCGKTVDASLWNFGLFQNSIRVWSCQIWFGCCIGLVIVGVVSFSAIIAHLQISWFAMPWLFFYIAFLMRKQWIHMALRLPLTLCVCISKRLVFTYLARCLNAKKKYLLERNAKEEAHLGLNRFEQCILYLIYPALSGCISLMIGFVVACDEPIECASTAWSIAANASADWMRLWQRAYHFDN